MTSAWLLVYRDQYKDRHALFSSYEAAGEQVLEVVQQYLDRNTSDFIGDDLKDLKELMARKAYQEVIDFWHTHTLESFDLEQYEIQGRTEDVERANVHAVLTSMAKHVLIEEVVGVNLSWKVGEPISSDITYQTSGTMEYICLQTTLPSLEDDGDKKPDES